MVEKINDTLYALSDHNMLASVPESGGPAVGSAVSIPKVTGAVGQVAYWGLTNSLPQDVIKDLETHSWVGSVLDWKARALFGGGLLYGKSEYKENGEEIFHPIRDKKIDDFFRKSNLLRSYVFPAINDFYYFYNVFPEIILTKDRSLVADINVKQAAFCRWELQNNEGVSPNCFYNVNWGTQYASADASVKIPAIDPFYDAANELKNSSSKAYRYIYPLSYPTAGRVYYSLAHWNTIRASGWLDTSNAIATYKKSLLKNQFTVKYLFETTLQFWKFKYPDYEDMKPEKKKEVHKAELDSLSKYMKGETNAGNSILTITFYDQLKNVSIPGLKITAIDDKLKDGVYIEDSQEASSHLLYALSVDGTLIGNAPGKGMGAGSGSDKRVAFNNYISLCEVHREIVLEPLYFIRDYNGWDPEIQFRFSYPLIMTLDKGKETQQQTS